MAVFLCIKWLIYFRIWIVRVILRMEFYVWLSFDFIFVFAFGLIFFLLSLSLLYWHHMHKTIIPSASFLSLKPWHNPQEGWNWVTQPLLPTTSAFGTQKAIKFTLFLTWIYIPFLVQGYVWFALEPGFVLLFPFLFIFYLSLLNVKVRRYFKTATTEPLWWDVPRVLTFPRVLWYWVKALK